jgi:hypothetical protein
MKKLLILGLLFAGTVHAQSSVSVNFGANVAFTGPNPYHDLTQYGLYAGTGAPITCSITSGSNTLSCGRGIGDFAVGQGIEIPLAGPAPTFEAWGTTAIDSYSRSGNVATYHVKNVIVGPPQIITISGLANSSFNGTFTITSMDGDNNHFTVANTGANVGLTAGRGVGTLTSPVVTVTPNGILNGTTRYDYKVVLRDYNGALSAASPAGTTLVGAATLGANTINVSSCSRTSGIVTCTTARTHNVQVGTSVTLTGTSTGTYDGQHVVASTPTSTTFTYDAFGAADDPGPPSGGEIIVPAKNVVQWNMQQYKTLQSFVYRSINSGAYQLVGIVSGMDGAFVDWGIPGGTNYIPTQATYISTGTPTATAVNGILAARITAISGNNITLSANTTANATSQPAAHDNAPVVIAGCNAIGAGGSGILYIPSAGPVAFNSVLNLRDNCTYPSVVNKIKIQVNQSQLVVNEPIVLRDQNTWIESIGGGGPNMAASTGVTSEITGNAYPLVYVPKGNGPTTMKNFLMDCYRVYQSCVVEEQDAGGGGVVNTDYDNMYFNGYAGSMPFIMRGGGFYHRFRRGGFSTASAYATPEPLLVTIPNALGIIPAAGVQLAGVVKFEETEFFGKGAVYETWGQPNIPVSYVTFRDNLFENGSAPLIRFNMNGGGVTGFDITNPVYSDSVNASTPIVEMGVGGTAFNVMRIYNPLCSSDFQPIFAGSGGGIELIGGCTTIGASAYARHVNAGTSGTTYVGGDVGIAGGKFFIQMANPGPVASLVAGAGGSVPVGIHYYSIVATDVYGNKTLPSLQTAITVASGNQTVTITPPTLPVGATGYIVYRNDSGSTVGTQGVVLNCTLLTAPAAPGSAYVDTATVPCGGSTPNVNAAALSSLSPTGLSGQTIKLTNNNWVDSITTPITANRTQTLPDVTGIIPVSSYVNSAYDPLRRANGAIGANYTILQGGLSITSNQLFGTVAFTRNLGYWNQNLFATPQFAEALVVNPGTGGSDDVGVATNIISGSTLYKCVESKTALTLIKFTANSPDITVTTALTGAANDLLRLENNNGALTCASKATNGTVTSVRATDNFSGGHVTLTGGYPGILIDGTSGAIGGWDGGNLHPLTHLDVEQNWTQPQHLNGWSDRGTTFTNLGTPANGTFYFCPDCTVANPCAGGGTGALAKRLNSVWVCN